MKVLLLHYAAPPIIGGVECVIGHHARLMAADGHEVSILAGRGAQTNSRIPFINLPQVDSRNPDILEIKAGLDKGNIPANFDVAVNNLIDKLGQVLHEFDVLFAHNVCSLSKNLPLTAALHKIFQKSDHPRLILWHHDLAWTTPRYQAELHPGYPWSLLRTDWPDATQVTISNPRQKELADLLQVPETRIKVIPNGIDFTQFLKLEAQTLKLIEKLDLFNAHPLFMLPVRITPRKNIELAIRTMSVLKRDYPDSRLVVTGPLGPHNPDNVKYFQLLTRIRSQLDLEKDIIFLAEESSEYIPDAVISDLYRLADALFFPSREEGFGIPILEAGISNLPVFCSDISALKALGKHWVTYFSPDSSPEYIAALIIDRLNADFAFNLRLRVKINFSWERIYNDYIKPLLVE